MTREELIKALRCFASEDYCPFDECNEKCPYWMETDKYDTDNPNAEISDVHQLCRAAADLLEQDVPPTDMVPKDFHDRCMEMEIERRMLLEQNAPKWISVKERMPDEDAAYMVFYHEWSNGEFLPKYDERYVKIIKFFRGFGWIFPVCVDEKCENDTNREVTHWMLLPEPPKEEKA